MDGMQDPFGISFDNDPIKVTCPRCGLLTDQEKKVCEYCGAIFTEEDRAEIVKNRKKLFYKGVIYGLIFFCIAGVVGFFLGK